MATTCHAGSSKHPRDTRAPIPRRQLLPCPSEVNCFDEGPKCCSYNPGIQYSLEQEMIQNRSSEIQKYSSDNPGNRDLRANFEILYGNPGKHDLPEQDISQNCACEFLNTVGLSLMEIWVYWNRKLITLKLFVICFPLGPPLAGLTLYIYI